MTSLRDLRGEGRQQLLQIQAAQWRRNLVRNLQHGNLEAVQDLLKQKLPDRSDSNLIRLALIVACGHLHVGVVSGLLALGADPNVGYEWEVFEGWEPRERVGILPLHVISQSQSHHADVAELVTILHHHGADPTMLDERDGSTPLGWTAANGQYRAVELLVRAGANIEVGFVGGRTPLIIAAACGHPLTVRTLLDQAANPNAATQQGTTALMAATGLCGGHKDSPGYMENCNARKREIVNMLLQRGAKTSSGARSTIRAVNVPPTGTPT